MNSRDFSNLKKGNALAARWEGKKRKESCFYKKKGRGTGLEEEPPRNLYGEDIHQERGMTAEKKRTRRNGSHGEHQRGFIDSLDLRRDKKKGKRIWPPWTRRGGEERGQRSLLSNGALESSGTAGRKRSKWQEGKLCPVRGEKEGGKRKEKGNLGD